MLQSIYIQNYALIDTLDISFTPGFSVITGETGAGKIDYSRRYRLVTGTTGRYQSYQERRQ